MDKRVIVIAYVLIAIACISLIYINADKIRPNMTSFSIKFTTACVDASKADEYINGQNCVKSEDVQCKEGEIGLKCYP